MNPDERSYPVDFDLDNDLFAKSEPLAKQKTNVIFGGPLVGTSTMICTRSSPVRSSRHE